MDFRKDLSTPGMPPYQATVARYTRRFVLLISSSKSFSYAGQRIAIMAISEHLYNSNFPHLLNFFPTSNYGHSAVLGVVYATTAGVTHTVQYGFLALLKAVNNGSLNFIEHLKVYEKRAKIVKQLFIQNGFNIVYDLDIEVPIADGFYFTVAFNGFSGEELIEELFYYGISAMPLSITGSERVDGIRACVSLINDSQIKSLNERLELFYNNHSTKS